MAALVCDICGGKLTMSTGGIAVCGSCGMEHTKERMQEKIQEIKGVVQVDNTHMIENYLTMAENAYSSNNSEEAESYCNKVLEIDPANYQAWFLKGKSAGWQSTINNPRFPEAVSAFSNAIKNAPEDKRDKIIEDAISEIKKLSEALLIVRGQKFEKWPDSDEQVGFANDLSVILDTILQFYTSIGILIDLDELHAPLAIIINKYVLDAWNNTIVPTFANDNDGHPDDYELKKLVKRAGYCTSLLETAIKISSTDDDADIQRYKNLIAIHTYMISAHSYEYKTVHVGYSKWDASSIYENRYVKSMSLTDENKAYRQLLINQYQEKIRAIETAKAEKDAARQAERERAAQEVAQARHEIYWKEHAEEKAALESEKQELESKINNITVQIQNIPGETEIINLEAHISELNSQKDALGLFKGKEKKVIKEKIDSVNSDIKKIRDKMELTKLEHEQQINQLHSRINEIDARLTTGGRNLGLSANSLKNMLEKELPGRILTASKEDPNAGFTKHINSERGWYLKVYKESNGEMKSEGVGILCEADSVSSDMDYVEFDCLDDPNDVSFLKKIIKTTVDIITEKTIPLTSISELFENNDDKEIGFENVGISYKATSNDFFVNKMLVYTVRIY